MCWWYVRLLGAGGRRPLAARLEVALRPPVLPALRQGGADRVGGGAPPGGAAALLRAGVVQQDQFGPDTDGAAAGAMPRARQRTHAGRGRAVEPHLQL
eukprot:1189702-Prorocentrum_minimum.AAC.1